MTTTKYNKYDPNRVHMEHGYPVIYNKADNRITQWEAERQFKKAVNTMHTWASRAFKLAAATPDPELRAYNLERFRWEIDEIVTWIGAIREVLRETDDRQHAQETIDKLIALAESTTFPEEADTARRMAAERQAKQG